MIYVISTVAETNRHPVDVVEGESEIVAGHMVEYSGMAFALFFLGEYANMIFLSAMAATPFPRGMGVADRFRALQLDPGLALAGSQGVCGGFILYLVPCDVPAISL